MARDDREQTFEKALARHLRANTPAQAGRAAHRPCADTETLAAYHERLLPPEQMTFWKEHISACSHCQEILAHVEATDALAEGAGKTEGDVHFARAGQEPPVLRIAKSRRRWLWAAPAGAIAAGLLVWIVLQEKPRSFELVKNQPAPASLPPTVSRSESVSTAVQPAPKGDREKSTPPLRSGPGDVAAVLGSKKSDEAKVLRTPSAKPLPSKDLRDRAADTFNPATSAVESPDVAGAISNQMQELDKQSVPAQAPSVPPMAETVVVSNEAVGLAPQAPAPPQAAPQKLSKAKATAPAAKLQSPAGRQVQQIEGMSRARFDDAPVMLLAGSNSPAVVSTPNPKVSWRVGRGGTLERSEDAGATWSVQVSGVISDLLAGSAPSEKVCWVIGQLGTILRTTDAGATWIKVRSPVAGDIRSVFAVSAQEATIFADHGSYLTVDGGVTWNKLPPE